MPDPVAAKEAFWHAVRRDEMEGRDRLSGMIRQLLAGVAPPPMSEQDQLIFRYRILWAMEFAKDRMRQNLPHPTLRECLLAALVVSWEEQGCLEFWRTDGID